MEEERCQHLHPDASLRPKPLPENTAGIIAAIQLCTVEAGGQETAYEHNTGGILRALLDLKFAIAQGSASGASKYIQMNLPADYDAELGSIVRGIALSIDPDGKVRRATSDMDRAHASVIGIAADVDTSKPNQPIVNVVVRGLCPFFATLEPGTFYFLDCDGYLTSEPPVGSGMFLTPMGEAVSPTTLDLQPQIPIELS